MTLEEELDPELHLEISTGQFRREFRESESLRVQLNDFVSDGTTDVSGGGGVEKKERVAHRQHRNMSLPHFHDFYLQIYYYSHSGYFTPVTFDFILFLLNFTIRL